MEKRIKASEGLYLLSYCAFIVSIYMFTEISYKPRAMWLLCPLFAFLIYVSIVLKRKYSYKILLLRLGIILVFSIASVSSNKPQVLVYSALLCGADTTNFIKIVKTCVATCLTTVLVTATLNATGLIQSVSEVYSRFGISIKTFGFGYYAIVPYTVFYLSVQFLFLKDNNNKRASWLELILITALSYGLYRLTSLRLTLYLTIILVLLYIVLIKFDWFDLRNKVLNILTLLIFPVLFTFSIWVNYAFDITNATFFAANRMLSNRLYLGHEALSRYSIKVFGNYIITSNGVGSEYFYIDCGFLFSLLGYGMLFTGVVLLMYIYMHNYSARVNDKMLFIWLTVVAIFSFSNNTWISMQINPILLYYPAILNRFITMRNKVHKGI